MVVLKEDTHNHSCLTEVNQLPVVRRSERSQDVVAKILSLSAIPKLSANDICTVIRNEHGVNFHDADVYNIRQKHKSQASEGRTPTQQFL